MYEVRLYSANITNIGKKLRSYNTLEETAIKDCLELFDYTAAELKLVLSDLAPKRLPVSKNNKHDLQTFLSAAMTNQYTCLDGFARSDGHVRSIIKKGLHNISHHISNSLSILNKVHGVNKSKPEAFTEHRRLKNGFPIWLSWKDRKLLQAPVTETKFDLVVAKDGTGNFTNITAAVAAAPYNSDTQYL
ncbi:probable pectinesterase/pectinesterase inhibitor 40 [Hibiscus syriacus]|uniref:probable pectinesterase/pectinesterase inhibitor 40 n=1 Tax=Hibiscus syriacus TaxID=106335 RepID=UPI0019246EDD|nr:probable pectinesterase/pectinesterase inhibitor 40 [Hibiscus syriacus]